LKNLKKKIAGGKSTKRSTKGSQREHAGGALNNHKVCGMVQRKRLKEEIIKRTLQRDHLIGSTQKKGRIGKGGGEEKKYQKGKPLGER